MLTLEQEFLIADFNRNIEKANLEEAKFLLKHLFRTSLEQKNHYIALMEHQWFKPKEQTLTEQLQALKSIADSIFNQLIQSELDWAEEDITVLFQILEKIDYLFTQKTGDKKLWE